MKNIKIIISAILVCVILSGYTFAKLAPISKRLIRFNASLISEHQKDWEDLDKKQKVLQEEIDEIVKEKEKLHEWSEMARMTISMLEGYPTEADTTDVPVVSGVFFTSYNPEEGQTDNSPCVGASMKDLCELNKTIRTIALSQDLVGRNGDKLFTYGDKVYLESDEPQCEGLWQVEDTMNARYTNRGDLFQMTRATNTSCTANIYLIN